METLRLKMQFLMKQEFAEFLGAGNRRQWFSLMSWDGQEVRGPHVLPTGGAVCPQNKDSSALSSSMSVVRPKGGVQMPSKQTPAPFRMPFQLPFVLQSSFLLLV